MKELQAIVRALCANPSPGAVLATLVRVEGSSYRRPGARLLLLPDGTRIGSISGGCLEEDVISRAQRVASTGMADMVVYDTTSENDLVWGVGLGCHGVVRVLIERLPARPRWAEQLAENFAARIETAVAVAYHTENGTTLGTSIAEQASCSKPYETFVERIRPPTRLCIFGAGDDAQPLARLGAEMGWRVTVADPRPAYATAERFPSAGSIVTAPVSDLVGKVDPDAGSLAVVMTHHYVHDVPLMRGLLARPLAYLGLLGPRKRAERILADLAAAGFTPNPEQRAKLHAPVGLDLGADGPEEVALSIVAEIQAVLADRNAQPLRERTRPIHE